MVTQWQQRRGLLSAAGPSPFLRVWDMASEQLWSQWEVGHRLVLSIVAVGLCFSPCLPPC